MRNIARRWHRAIGLVMLLPLTGWALTGAIFYIKPGYAAAYRQLQIRSYPLADAEIVTPRPDWQEMRLIRTILGTHLLIRTADGWSQLDPHTLATRNEPSQEEIRALVRDAIESDVARYGEIAKVEASSGDIITTTGVRISLEWPRLSLSQRGRDTDRIDILYRIHYLQWTGIAAVDRVIGVVGIVLVLTLAWLGARLLFVRPRS